MLLAIAVEEKMHLHQLDVSTAYLNGDLQDEIYMQQPKNFINESQPEKVLKLQKAIYGLKQSGRQWNFKLDEVLQQIGFVASKDESCLYRMYMEDELVLIAVYVDDMIIACKNKVKLEKVKALISEKFEVVDKGVLQHFLGIEIDRDGEVGSITLSQKQYIRDLLQLYGMENCKSVAVPLEAGYQVACTEDCCKADVTQYQSLIGALMHLGITTRPDILHSVSKLSQRNIDPHIEHMTAAKHILRYLRGSINCKLSYRAGSKRVEGYVDADWASDAYDRKSYTGFVFLYGHCTISWESKKQSTIALSSTEAEYIAASNAAKEAVYLQRLLKDIGFWKDDPIVLHIDNQGAQKLATNPVYHNRTKHIDVRYHHIRELVNDGRISLTYCPTEQMTADIFTKNLSKVKQEKFIKQMNIL